MDGNVIFFFTYMPIGDDSALATEQEWTEILFGKTFLLYKKAMHIK